MDNSYAVVGSGKQGVASAYDIARFGKADKVILADLDLTAATKAAKRVNRLIGDDIAEGVKADVSNRSRLASVLKGIDAVVSAVPYRFNLDITKAAIRVRASMSDMGGHTGIVRKQLALDAQAKKAGITIVPDCGMGPGLNISLAVHAMSLLDRPKEVLIWDGGLPQDPEPPWNYVCTFSLGGLTNEYDGHAYFIRNGKVTEVPCFDGYETLEFPEPIGKLEAFVTSGGLSTAPWTFEGKLQRLENKTLRYPGHVAQFKAFAQLGLLEQRPIKAGKTVIAPRDVFHALLAPRITRPEIKDVCVMRVRCVGEKNGRPATATIELIDRYDEKTGFTAMQRLTGWHASIVAMLAAKGKLPRGAISVEKIPGKLIINEFRKRGIKITTRIEKTTTTKT